MKTVLFFRHAKSDWDAPYRGDHERPLAGRGRKAADTMGRWLAARGPVPDRILCSTARRTVQTLMRAVTAGDWDSSVRFYRKLYGATPELLLETIREQPDHLSCVMLLGHQPTLSMTVTLLSGQETGHFPTAAVACVQVPVHSWADAAFGAGRLLWLQRPREL